MAARIRRSAGSELSASAPSMAETVQRFQDGLSALGPTEAVAVLEAATRALSSGDEPTSPVVSALTGGRRFAVEERVEAELDLLGRSFGRRRELLAGALSTAQVATLLDTSRQTPHDRVASGTLLAVMDRGVMRFPPWQFDPDGADGVVMGLPAVIRALDVSPMAKVGWLLLANPTLDGATPLACLKAGDVERVLALARGVGVA